MSTGAIVGVGMSTPLGLDARQSALVFRARKLTPTRTEFRDRHGFAMGNVRARRLDDALVGRDRLLALAAPALREALVGVAGGSGLAEPVPLFLSVPPRRSADEVPLGPTFLADLEKAARVSIALDGSEAIALGHAGFATALSRAIASVAARPLKGPRDRRALAIAGGVDSHHDPAVLAALDKARRVHGGGAKDGFIPSEGAAFVVVAASDAAPAYARVLGVTSGMEREEADSGVPGDEPPIGEAMTEVVRGAAALLGAGSGLGAGGLSGSGLGAGSEPVPWVLCDVNGERHRVKEWSFARIRNPEAFDDERTVETRPCDEMGDMGAATGAAYAALVCVAFRMGFAPAQRALVALSSDGGARGAFALEAR